VPNAGSAAEEHVVFHGEADEVERRGAKSRGTLRQARGTSESGEEHEAKRPSRWVATSLGDIKAADKLEPLLRRLSDACLSA